MRPLPTHTSVPSGVTATDCGSLPTPIVRTTLPFQVRGSPPTVAVKMTDVSAAGTEDTVRVNSHAPDEAVMPPMICPAAKKRPGMSSLSVTP